MRTIVRITFGSHLYGTETPASDLDFKSVYVPDGRDILLQRVKGSISTKRSKTEGERNVAGELDEESYSLQRYLGLVAEGQTVALDMLFAPPAFQVVYPLNEWKAIQINRSRLLTKKSVAFVGYCRQQANKYGIKGSRVAAAKLAQLLLQTAVSAFGCLPTDKLAVLASEIESLAASTEHMATMNIEGGMELDGIRRTVRHWEVCGRKMPFTQTIAGAAAVVNRLIDNYGHRAIQAESNQGIDWKALSHAVRIGRQATEFLSTGFITFPRPERAHLIAIKTGALPYQQVAEEIESLLVAVEGASTRSSLPEAVDQQWIDDFVAETYLRELRR